MEAALTGKKMAELRAEREAAEAEKARQAARKTVKELFEHWADIDLKNRKMAC